MESRLTFLTIGTVFLFEREDLMLVLCPDIQSITFVLPGMEIHLVNHFLVFLFKEADV
jgi:hypothetical protein